MTPEKISQRLTMIFLLISVTSIHAAGLNFDPKSIFEETINRTMLLYEQDKKAKEQLKSLGMAFEATKRKKTDVAAFCTEMKGISNFHGTGTIPNQKNTGVEEDAINAKLILLKFGDEERPQIFMQYNDDESRSFLIQDYEFSLELASSNNEYILFNSLKGGNYDIYKFSRRKDANGQLEMFAIRSSESPTARSSLMFSNCIIDFQTIEKWAVTRR